MRTMMRTTRRARTMKKSDVTRKARLHHQESATRLLRSPIV
jgi:hypothetical protein